MENTALNELLGNYSKDLFFENFWGKQFLHLSKTERERHEFPLSIDKLDDIFTNTRLKYPWVKVIKEGEEIPLNQFRNYNFSQLTDFVSNDQLFNLLNEGATVIVNSMDKIHPATALFCRKLENELSVKVWANLYITPAGNKGFRVHQDAHDVMVVQLFSKKNWQIYATQEGKGGSVKISNEVEKELILEEGELIYLPKGCPHAAYAAEDSPSVHLSLSMEGLSWVDLIRQFAERASKEQDFQKRVPTPLEGKANYEAFLVEFKESWKNFNENAHPLDEIENKRSAMNYQADAQIANRLSDFLNQDEITLDTVLQKRTYVAYELKNQGKFVKLQFLGKSLLFPVFTKTLLQALLQENPYRLKTIEAGQSENEKIILSKKLIREGLLTIVELR